MFEKFENIRIAFGNLIDGPFVAIFLGVSCFAGPAMVIVNS